MIARQEQDNHFAVFDFHSKQNELRIATDNNGRSSPNQISPNDSKIHLPQIFASLGATGIDATESEVTSTEIKQECCDFEFHESTSNDNNGTTDKGLIHSIKAECSGQEDTEENDSQIPSVSSTELTVVVKTEQIDPTTNSENNCTSNTMTFTKAEPAENFSAMPVRLRLDAALRSYFEPSDFDAIEAQPNSLAIPTGRTPRISSRKRCNVSARSPERSTRQFAMEELNFDSDEYNGTQHNPVITTDRAPRISIRKQLSSERRYPKRSAWKTIVLDSSTDSDEYDENEYTPVQKKTSRKPSTSRNKRSRDESEYTFQSEAYSVGSSRQRSRSISKRPTELLKLLPAADVKITKIFINIYNENASFETSDGQKSRNRPLRDYVSILRHSKADVLGCEAYIYFYFRNLGRDPSEDARKKFKTFSQEIRSIAHLWVNGRVTTELNDYPKQENDVLPLSDFCDELFSQGRSILECRALHISIWSADWPLSVVTNGACRCNRLILKETRGRDEPLHYRLMDILYEGKLPHGIEVTLDLFLNKSKNDFIDELKKRFQSATEQNFKLIMLCSPYSAPPNMLLRNEHGSTLRTKTVAQYSVPRDCVMIEQRSGW
ncbi:hypothetical protein DdX_14438 [Ditylenchus destructor]|uniref:Uncharacterized protein n=1 Tax=Ditylenchus destructor TaxID=166010 RepID=A0AAD4MWW1_9BILA|nr:hypothetical protein DdX_14438 [Ditylenchus destructor]